jgi:membrane fusion protein (multidrug efflux system)
VSAFSRSLRSIGADRARGRRSGLALAAALVIVGAWAAWFVAGRVTLWEVSSKARLEVDREVHPLEAQVAGRVVSSTLQLGRPVRAGEILVELDSESEKRRMEQESKRLAALEPQLAALDREMAAEQQTVRASRDATRSAVDSARARESEAQAASQFADEESRRLAQLKAKEGISELEMLRVKAEELKRRAAAQALTLDAQRIEADQRTRDSQARARIEQLRKDMADLQGQIATVGTAVQVLETEIEKRRVRAPVAGQLGEVANLSPGAVVGPGERVGAVVPSGQLRVVAQFPPAAALGRVRKGQPARVRLEGFPWLQYGSLSARVDTVAQEPRDGLVRVELEVLPSKDDRIPLQHGLPGVVEVDVERISPATLMLRAAGQLAARPVVEQATQ